MEISLLKAFQHIEVVALDVKVLCCVEVHALLQARAQRGADWRISCKYSLALIGPSKLIALFPTLHDGIGKLLPQHVKINGVFYLAVAFHLGNCIGEQLADQLNVALYTVKAVHF